MHHELATSGYRVAPGLVSRQLADTVYATLLIRAHRGEFRRDDQVPTAQSFWGDSTLDGLLVALRPDVERIAGDMLVPTYAYARIYRDGDRLERHRDRASCEVVASVHLGRNGGAPPPLRFEPDAEIEQEPGDAVVFLGTRLDHWRDPHRGDHFAQVFLNYVRAEGARAGQRYDGRGAQFPPDAVHPGFFSWPATTQRSG